MTNGSNNVIKNRKVRPEESQNETQLMVRAMITGVSLNLQKVDSAHAVLGIE